jgi:hypothetical protein
MSATQVRSSAPLWRLHARQNGGLIITASAPAQRHRELLTKLAAEHKLPVVYFERYFVPGGGLLSTDPILWTNTGTRPGTSIAFSGARSRATFQCRHRLGSRW